MGLNILIHILAGMLLKGDSAKSMNIKLKIRFV